MEEKGWDCFDISEVDEKIRFFWNITVFEPMRIIPN